MRRLFQSLLYSLLGVMLVTGCGGSEDPYTTTDLESAYEAIAAGMSYTVVRNVVDREPVSQTVVNTDSVLYRWESNKGTYLFSTLLVQIHRDDGVVSKTITGPNLSETDTFNSE